MARKAAATSPASTGDSTQLAVIAAIDGQLTADSPAAATPPPATPPTIACVVDTGARMKVDRWIHRAAAISAATISRVSVAASSISPGSTIPAAIVSTTRPPAMSAPATSQTAAMASAPPMRITRAPTAGPTLLATSLAPMLSAM